MRLPFRHTGALINDRVAVGKNAPPVNRSNPLTFANLRDARKQLVSYASPIVAVSIPECKRCSRSEAMVPSTFAVATANSSANAQRINEAAAGQPGRATSDAFSSVEYFAADSRATALCNKNPFHYTKRAVRRLPQ